MHLLETEQNQQQVQHDEIHQFVFEIKEKACKFLKENDGSSMRSRSSRSRRSKRTTASQSPRRSQHSHVSKVSNLSKLESLKAEEKALLTSQKAKQEELDCYVKLETAKMETERTRLQQKITKVQIVEVEEQGKDNNATSCKVPKSKQRF